MQNEESNEVRIVIHEFGEEQNANGEDSEKTTDASAVVDVVKSQNQESTDTKLQSLGPGKDEKSEVVQKGCLPRSDSFCDNCRVCQQQSEEALVELGCQCRGDLAKAHRSCIDAWFRTRGSNRCRWLQMSHLQNPILVQTIGYGGSILLLEDQILDEEIVKGDALVRSGWHSQSLLADFCWMCLYQYLSAPLLCL